MPVDEVSVSVEAGGIDVKTIRGYSDTTRLNQAGVAEIKKGLATELPLEGDEFKMDINGERVFTGIVYSSSVNEDGTISIKAFDQFIKLKQAERCAFTENDRIRNIIKRILEAYDVDYRIQIDDDRKIVTTVELSHRKPEKVLWWLTKWLDILWWIDTETGELVVGNPSVEQKDIEFVLGSNVENGSPTYEKVIAYGESPKSRKGQQTEHLVAKERLKGTAGNGEPVLRTKSRAIRSQEQADRAAKALLRESWIQAKMGTVDIVGREDIRLFDRMTMPEILGGQTHTVTGIRHKLSNEDGYTTTLSVGADPEEIAIEELETLREEKTFLEKFAELQGADPEVIGSGPQNFGPTVRGP